MAKVSVEVLDAVVDGKGKGEVISIEEKSAKHLESLNYVKIVKGATKKKASPKKESVKDSDK